MAQINSECLLMMIIVEKAGKVFWKTLKAGMLSRCEFFEFRSALASTISANLRTAIGMGKKIIREESFSSRAERR